ncbi:MAG: HepT-like ribonuclease domain-containing protein [Bacteroidia bacterium]
MNAKPSERERLIHIVKAIDRIFRFCDTLTYETFSQDEMAQFAIIKNFEIIGEAAHQLSVELREKNNHMEWRKIIAFHHILVHDYYKINTVIIWNAIENKLRDLKRNIEKMLEENS